MDPSASCVPIRVGNETPAYMRHVSVRQTRAARVATAALLPVVFLITGMATAPSVSRDHLRSSGAFAQGPPTVPRPVLSASTSARSSTRSGPAAPKSSPRPPRDDDRADLAKAVAAYGGPGTVSVAAVNLATGVRYASGSTHGQWIASAYKLLLVECLLLREHGNLSDGERSDAALAIEQSDNLAGYRLYDDLGGQPGMMEQLRRLGVKHFSPGLYDPTLSTTSASDLVQALRALVDPAPLSAASRSYVLNLLGQVEADQRWGVGAATTSGDALTKNGWLSIDDDNPAGETDDGLWAVNSMGIVNVHGHKVLMAVMTQHNDDFGDGVSRVERLAKLLAVVVAP